MLTYLRSAVFPFYSYENVAKNARKVATLFYPHLNRTARIRHQCRKGTVLSSHRCRINTGFEKWTTFK